MPHRDQGANMGRIIATDREPGGSSAWVGRGVARAGTGSTAHPETVRTWPVGPVCRPTNRPLCGPAAAIDVISRARCPGRRTGPRPPAPLAAGVRRTPGSRPADDLRRTRSARWAGVRSAPSMHGAGQQSTCRWFSRWRRAALPSAGRGGADAGDHRYPARRPGATRSAVMDRMCGGRRTLTGVPLAAPSIHTLACRRTSPPPTDRHGGSQLTDAIDIPLIRICNARAAELACGFAAADRKFVYSVDAVAFPLRRPPGSADPRDGDAGQRDLAGSRLARDRAAAAALGAEHARRAVCCRGIQLLGPGRHERGCGKVRGL